MQAALEHVRAEFGGLNALVNCAGIGLAARTVSSRGPHPLEDFEAVIRVNLVGSFNCIRLAAALMAGNTPNEAGERGVIINSASVAAFRRANRPSGLRCLQGRHRRHDPAHRARPGPQRHPRLHDCAGHIRYAAAGQLAGGGARFAGRASALPAAPGQHRPNTLSWRSRSSRTPCSTARRSAWTAPCAWAALDGSAKNSRTVFLKVVRFLDTDSVTR